jgi:hypothetical protein
MDAERGAAETELVGRDGEAIACPTGKLFRIRI